jgi:hypothetical protein
VLESTFKALFCRRYGCQPSDYEEFAFKYCLYGHARFIAPVIHLMSPNFFEQDFKFIGFLGASTSVKDVTETASDFHDKSNHVKGFWSRSLKLRVSGRKAIKLAHALFSEPDPAG